VCRLDSQRPDGCVNLLKHESCPNAVLNLPGPSRIDLRVLRERREFSTADRGNVPKRFAANAGRTVQLTPFDAPPAAPLLLVSD
jgi:hypothetical protein